MKNIINALIKCAWLLLLIVMDTSVGFAQASAQKIYYNYKWKKVKDASKASYYRTEWLDGDTLKVLAYDSYNNELVQKGSYTGKGLDTKDGWFELYEKGIKASEGNYRNNKKEGIWKFWEKGIKTSEGNYNNDKKEGEWKYWTSDYLSRKGNFINDKEEGAWEVYHNNGKVKANLFYKADSIVSSIEFNADGIELTDNDTFSYPDQVAEFLGETSDMYSFLGRNIQYPVAARENGMEGKVIVEFIVNREGTMVNPVMFKSDTYFDEETLRVVNLMKRWKCRLP